MRRMSMIREKENKERNMVVSEFSYNEFIFSGVILSSTTVL
jgi:hypothetical protein